MTASSGVVLGNLAYLIGAVVLAFIGGFIVWLHYRQPKSVDANVESFSRGLRALAPDASSPASRRSPPGADPAGLRIQPRRAEEGQSETEPQGEDAGGATTTAEESPAADAADAADDPPAGPSPTATDPEDVVVDLSGPRAQEPGDARRAAAKRAGAETG